MTISVCLIVRDEEEVLARCLDCAARFADEIVVADTGSGDRTMEIAGRYTTHVYQFPWRDDFAAARNFSFSKATCDYIMWLDADDVVDEENIRRLIELKETLPADVDAVMMKYNVGFDEAGRVTFHYYRERLARRDRNFQWQEPVHEHLAVSGNIRYEEITVTHGQKTRKAAHSTRNLEIYEGRVMRGERLSARGMYYFARELATHGRHRDALLWYERFLAQPDGWVEDRISACGGMAGCHEALGETEQALEALFQSFLWDAPRPEICCRIGRLFLNGHRDGQAVYWYEQALSLPKPQGLGFVAEDYCGYIPHLQLCVLHDRAGRREAALRHHEAAKAIRPESAPVRHNQAYFYPQE